MAKTTIKTENLSKSYRLGEVGTGTLSQDLNRWYHMQVLGQDDPNAKLSNLNDRTKKGTRGEFVAALRNINLEVKEGEVLGIIGKNGAGKSTLLKLLSRITSPTTGTIKVKGRMASLLEIGTGFHPELTGRENIYMNGTIMSMRKWEIEKKFDEIVSFAGVARYIDTPIKRYSSGMTVRLGFAVAAHLESEILIVDEVLAVGDAEFQKKAIGKMRSVSQSRGRTVLFVSHNMSSMSNLCQSGIVIENGCIIKRALIDDTINFYIKNQTETQSSHYKNNTAKNEEIYIKEIRIGCPNQKQNIYLFDESLTISIIVTKNNFAISPYLGIAVKDGLRRKIFTTISPAILIQEEEIKMCVTIPKKTLLSGRYSLDAALFNSRFANYDSPKDICHFEIIPNKEIGLIYEGLQVGSVNINCSWKID